MRGAQPRLEGLTVNHVPVNKEHVDSRRLHGKVAIVVDVLFASTSSVVALEHGATEDILTVDGNSALEVTRQCLQ